MNLRLIIILSPYSCSLGRLTRVGNGYDIAWITSLLFIAPCIIDDTLVGAALIGDRLATYLLLNDRNALTIIQLRDITGSPRTLVSLAHLLTTLSSRGLLITDKPFQSHNQIDCNELVTRQCLTTPELMPPYAIPATARTTFILLSIALCAWIGIAVWWHSRPQPEETKEQPAIEENSEKCTQPQNLPMGLFALAQVLQNQGCLETKVVWKPKEWSIKSVGTTSIPIAFLLAAAKKGGLTTSYARSYMRPGLPPTFIYTFRR